MKHIAAVSVWSICAAVIACGGKKPSPAKAAEAADVLVFADNIVPMTTPEARATALAVSGGRIVFVGDRSAAMSLRGPKTQLVELGTATVLPGLIDSHMHFSRLGTRLRTVFLDEAKSADEVVAIAKEQAERTPRGEWITGRGWHTVGWTVSEYPADHGLSKAIPDHPVYLSGMANHAAWVNRAALSLAGIDRNTPDPPDGRIVRDAKGEATGILLEGAKELVSRHLPPVSREQMKKDILASVHTAARLGLTSVHDAGVGEPEIDIYRELAETGELGVRLYVMRYVEKPGPDLDEALSHPPVRGDRLTVRALKVYADGALGARGAALLEPYADAPSESGLVSNGPAELDVIFRRATEAGYQVAVHAIGDRGNRNVLDAVDRAIQGGTPPLRPRVEHAQIIAPVDIERFGALGVIPAMQPIHATMDMGFAPARLGPERLRGAYAWRSLTNAGAHLASGADVPAFPIPYSDPLLGLYTLVTRQDRQGLPEGGWLPAERLDRFEALRTYGWNGAFAAFEDHEKGTLEVGKLADLTVFDRDVTRVPAAELLTTRVVMTLVGGAVTYDRRREAP